MSQYRLMYVDGAYDDRFRTIVYPSRRSPGFSSRKQAEYALAAMPQPALMCIVEED